MKLALSVAATAALLVVPVGHAAKGSTRSLSDAHVGTTKAELIDQRDYSARVIRRLSHSWKVAPRHATCWSHVPWSRTCDRARHRMFAHRWLHKVAVRKLNRMYPPAVASHTASGPSWLVNAFKCIHGYEGAWDANTGNGYYGGLQFDYGSWVANGGQRYAPTANLASPAEQLAVAFAYYERAGFSPWPNTARYCGLR